MKDTLVIVQDHLVWHQEMGCWRFPLPTDSKMWESCINSSKYDDGSTIVDAITGAPNILPNRLNKDELAKFKNELDACKKRFYVGKDLDYKMKYVDGLEYLKNNDYPLLEVPDAVDKDIKSDIDNANKVISKQLQDKEKKLKAKAEKSIAMEVSKKIAKDPETYKSGAAKAKIALEYDMQLKQKRLTEIQQEIKASRGFQKNSPTGAANQHEKALLLERNKLTEQMNQSKRDQAHLDSLIKGIDVAADVMKFEGMYNNISSQDKQKNAQAILDSTKLVQKYFNQYKKNVVDLSDFKQFTQNKMSDSEFKNLMNKSNNLNAISDVLGTTVKAGEYGMDIYDNYKKYQEIKNKAMELYNSGHYSDAQANMLRAFDTMSYLTDKAADYMPSGMNDMLKFYAEAMKTPAKFDQIMRDIVNKDDSMANIKGDQANTYAMREYEKKHGDIANNDSLDREPYLYRKAGLSVYKMNNSSDPRPYVIMARGDKEPIYVDEKTYRKIKELAFYYPIVHKKRLTDTDLYEQLAGVGEKGTINIQDLVNKAKEVMQRAANDKRIADMYGKKTLTHEEHSQWFRFNEIMSASLPKACALEQETQKRLFNSFLQGTEKVGYVDESLAGKRINSGRDSVIKYLKEYGAKLKMAESEGGG